MTATTNYFESGKMTYENGILQVEYNQGVIIDEKTLFDQIACRRKLTGDEDFFMVINMSNAKDITDGALALAASNPNPEHVKAIATITRYGVDYTRSKLYSVFDRPNIKTKAFLSLEAAKTWFESMELMSLKKAS